MEIIKKNFTTNTTLKKGRTIKYIVIHYTAGVSSVKGKATSTANYFSKDSTKASADFIVDNETIVQYNGDIKNRYSWHCGGSKLKTKGGSLYGKCTNANSIGVEMCSKNLANKITDPNDINWDITAGTFDCTVKLVANLCKEYNIPLENVIRHYDVTGKLCPGVIGWNEDSGDISEWKSFKNSVAEELNEIYKDNLEERNKELEEKVAKLEKDNAEKQDEINKLKEILKNVKNLVSF